MTAMRPCSSFPQSSPMGPRIMLGAVAISLCLATVMAGCAPPRLALVGFSGVLLTATVVFLWQPPSTRSMLVVAALLLMPCLHLCELFGETLAADRWSHFVVAGHAVGLLVGLLVLRCRQHVSADTLFMALAASLLPLACMGILDLRAPGFELSSLGPSVSRVMPFGAFIHPGHAGTLFGAAAAGCATFSLSRSGPRNARIASALLACLFAGLCIATRSRAGFAAMVLVTLLYSRRQWYAYAVALVCVAAPLLFFPEWVEKWAHGDRFRVRVWQDTYHLLAQRPWMGFGPGGFEEAFPAVKSFPHFLRFSHPESTWLTLLAEYGVVGFLPFAFLAGWVCSRGAGARPARAAWYVLLLHSLVDFTWYTSAVFLYVCAFGALALSRREGGRTDDAGAVPVDWRSWGGAEERSTRMRASTMRH